MLLGFISLLLVVLQSPVSQICIPERIAATWHPCSREQELAKYGKDYIDDGREVLEDYDFNDFYSPRRSLATKGYDKCAEKAYPERFRFARDTSFGRRHLNIWTKSSFTLWIAHMPAGSEARFDFQKYIQRSLEEDFKAVVGISPVIWCIAVLFILTNTHGAKLQVIISKLGLRIQDKGDVVKGAPVVEPGDDLFWFGRPRFILFLIHLVLFTNAFQLAFFVWSTYEFTLKNCFHHKTVDIALRITMGVLIQVVCSYITLPLYALVTQMGTSMRPTIFNDRVANALKKWHKTAKKQSKHGTSGSNTPHSSRPATPTHGMSPMHLLHSHNRSLDYQTSFTASSSPPRFSDFGGHGHGHQHFFDPESQNVSPHLEIVESDISNSQHPHADIASQHQHADVTSPVKEEKETTEHVKIDLPEFTFKK
ncbi:hypothetical protein F2Q70_00008620 [Brassica cretica]|uniref:MLO-like protein n=1 Tax=Brassica cretica TaxID=69181 RepID=A0A8S9M7N7_BRACR|nr:hypothetical protein F2Q70_00008620 [Brassica cretica]